MLFALQRLGEDQSGESSDISANERLTAEGRAGLRSAKERIRPALVWAVAIHNTADVLVRVYTGLD